MEEHRNLEDPCAEFGSTQRAALAWFFVMLVFGSALTIFGSKLDRRMYDTNAEYLDYSAYRENRISATSIGGEAVDSRKGADLISTVAKTKK